MDDIGLGIAGLLCVAMAIGHAAMGLVWVLPGLTEDRLPSTPFGPKSMTLAMVRVTWYIVTVFALALGGLLLNLAWETGADPKMLALRWFAAMWLTGTGMALWFVRHRPRGLLRLPVPVFWVLVAVLCWTAST
jgi:hypothetical protein